MYSYREQIEIIEKIVVKDGQGFNIDCPFCGGRKTFGIARRDGKKMWHCFKVSCGIKGVQSAGMSTSNIRKRLAGVEDKAKTKKFLAIPSPLGDPINYPAAIEYIKQNNCYHAYENNLVPIRFDPVDRRVLFFNKDMSGAVGRSITGQVPKWKQYGDIPGILTVGNGSIGVVVEDAPSACAVSLLKDHVGCALLGTSLNPLQKRQLRLFSKLIIALDKDARGKSVTLASKLEGTVKTRIVFLEEDLKCLTGQQIKDLIR